MTSRRSIQILAAALFFLNVSVFVFKPGGDQFMLYFGDVFTPLCALLACHGLNAARRCFDRRDLAGRAWLFVFLGLVALFLADTAYAILELAVKMDMENVFPTLADGFYILAYLPIIAALAMFLAGYRRGGLSFGRWQVFLLPLAALMVVGIVLVARFVFMPILADQETSVLAKAVYLYYPVADIVVLTLSAMLVYLSSLLGSGAFSSPWRYMALGFLALTVGDILFAYFSWSSQYSTGSIADFGWNVAYLLVAIAGCSQKEVMDSIAA